MPEQAVEHAGQTTEERWTGPPVLGEVRGKAEQQGKAQQAYGTLAKLDTPAKYRWDVVLMDG